MSQGVGARKSVTYYLNDPQHMHDDVKVRPDGISKDLEVEGSIRINY
jgi:hypothetical protein